MSLKPIPALKHLDSKYEHKTYLSYCKTTTDHLLRAMGLTYSHILKVLRLCLVKVLLKVSKLWPGES